MPNKNPKSLPTDEQMLVLKRELNFLLWTSNAPPLPTDFPVVVESNGPLEQAKINIQCVAHTLVTTAIFMGFGYDVTTRGGMAFILDTSDDGNPDNDLLNQIAKHWWCTVDGHGVVDLSLNGESENPLIYCNRSIGGRWRVAFGENRQKLNGFLNARQRGCFYFTLAKREGSQAALAQDLAQPFKPAKEYDLMIPYSKIVRHCEGLLVGTTESLTNLTQERAWRSLV